MAVPDHCQASVSPAAACWLKSSSRRRLLSAGLSSITCCHRTWPALMLSWESIYISMQVEGTVFGRVCEALAHRYRNANMRPFNPQTRL